MKYSYFSEPVSVNGRPSTQYRIQADGMGRACTCNVLENAKLVVDRMNKGEMAPLLALALKRLREQAKAPVVKAPWEALDEADRALAEWEQLTKL